jgi:hypothetical protein
VLGKVKQIGLKATPGEAREAARDQKRFSGGNTRCSLKIELCDKLRAPSGHPVSGMALKSFN